MIDTNVPASRPSILGILSRICREVIGYFQPKVKSGSSTRAPGRAQGRPH